MIGLPAQDFTQMKIVKAATKRPANSVRRVSAEVLRTRCAIAVMSLPRSSTLSRWERPAPPCGPWCRAPQAGWISTRRASRAPRSSLRRRTTSSRDRRMRLSPLEPYGLEHRLSPDRAGRQSDGSSGFAASIERPIHRDKASCASACATRRCPRALHVRGTGGTAVFGDPTRRISSTPYTSSLTWTTFFLAQSNVPALVGKTRTNVAVLHLHGARDTARSCGPRGRSVPNMPSALNLWILFSSAKIVLRVTPLTPPLP